MAKKTVAIVGAGLVGRLAGWAAMLSGYKPTLIYRGPYGMYVPRGYVYLHEKCELPLVEHLLTVDNFGTAEGYAQKVYGDPSLPTSFWDTGPRTIYHPAQALRLLEILQQGMTMRFDASGIKDITELLERGRFDKAIVTIPINQLFPGVNFRYVTGSVTSFPVEESTPNFCVYSGSPATSWNRAGTMFGVGFHEYPNALEGAFPITKIIKNTEPRIVPDYDGVLFTGRYGKWTGQLAHESFKEVLEWLASS